MAGRRQQSGAFRGYLVALAATAAMVLPRGLMDPVMGEYLPLATLYGAVAVAVWFGGYRPGLLATALGYLACDFLFIEPRGTLGFRDLRNLIGLILYLLSCAIIIAFGEAMRAARLRAEASRQDALARQRQLEQEGAARLAAEEALRAAVGDLEQRAKETEQTRNVLQTLFDNIPEGVVLVGGSPDFPILANSRYGQALLGRPPDTAVGVSAGYHAALYGLLLPDGATRPAPEDLPLFRASRYGERVQNAEFLVERPDGSRIAVLVDAVPIRAGSGEVVGAVSCWRDITDRKGAEEALRAVREQLQIITNTMSSPVTRCSRDLRYLWVSQPYADWIGRPAGEIIGRPIRDVLGEEAFRQLRPRFDQVLAGQRVQYEEEVNYPGLGPRWIHAIYTPTFDRTGVPDGWVAVVQDITEQKRTEEELRRAEERVRSVVDHVLDGIITIDESGTVQSFNPSAEKLFGYEAAEVISRNVRMLMPEPYRREHDGYLAAYRRGGPAKIIGIGREVEGCRKDGSTFPMDLAVSEFRLGQRRYFTGIVRDITERKRIEQALRFSEQQARAFLDNSAIIAWLKDEQGRNVFLSENYVRRFGLENWKDKTDFELWPQDIAEVFRRNDLVVLGRDRPFECIEEARTPNGEVSTWLNSKFWFQDESGKKYVGGVGVDITERKRAEGALQEADRRKNDFLATLAHELRNPLAPLCNAVELLRRAGGQADLTEKVRAMMERQLTVMVRLIDDLLDVSRITRGKLQLRKEPVELASVVRSAVEAARPAIEAQGHELTVTLPPQPIPLVADPVRLGQVFSNLLTNAVKYTEKGGRIWLTAERAGGEVMVSVRDTGIGIAAEHLPHLFEMFSQVDSALEGSQGGLGIGLALVRGVVQLHGGSVQARSDGPGRGSEFLVRLPVAEAPIEKAAEPSDAENAHRDPLCRILVVDDNRDAADSLARMLRLMGHDIQMAHDGREAIEAAGSFRPEVVLLDIGLPQMNGYEVARCIREQAWGKDMTLIALTGWTQEEDKRRSWEAGFDHHLTKPVNFAALEKLLVRAPRAAVPDSPGSPHG